MYKSAFSEAVFTRSLRMAIIALWPDAPQSSVAWTWPIPTVCRTVDRLTNSIARIHDTDPTLWIATSRRMFRYGVDRRVLTTPLAAPTWLHPALFYELGSNPSKHRQ